MFTVIYARRLKGSNHQSVISKKEGRRQGSTYMARLKASISDSQLQQQQRCMEGHSEHHRYKSWSAPIICEAKLPDEFKTIYPRFDLPSRVSCQIHSAFTRSASAADVRRTPLRVNMRKAARPDNIPGRAGL